MHLLVLLSLLRHRRLSSLLLLLDLQLSPFQRLLLPLLHQIIPILHRDTLRHMIDFIDSHKAFRKLEHIIAEGDDNELCVLRSFFDVACNNAHLLTYN